MNTYANEFILIEEHDTKYDKIYTTSQRNTLPCLQENAGWKSRRKRGNQKISLCFGRFPFLLYFGEALRPSLTLFSLIYHCICTIYQARKRYFNIQCKNDIQSCFDELKNINVIIEIFVVF